MAAAPRLAPLHERVLELVRALRRAGVDASQTEAVEVVRSLPHVDLLDRAQLREALAATTVTGPDQRRLFDELFDVHLPARPAGPAGETATGEADGDPDRFVHELLDRLESGDDEAVAAMARAAVARFGGVEGRDGGTAYFRYRVYRAVDTSELLRRLLQRRDRERDDRLSDLQRRLLRDELRSRIERFEDEVSAEVQRRAVEQRGREHVADRAVSTPLEEVDFFRLSREQQAEMRRRIRPLARRLATRSSAERRRGRGGRLDVRRTVRRSLATGGVPFEPVLRPRRPNKPELFVLCDVSGSVASFARFTLTLVHALQEQFARVRSFAFIDTLDEVTGLLADAEPGQVVTRMRSERELVRLDGHSDYGHSLRVFHERHGRDVTPRSTVLILGDARNNHRRPRGQILAELSERARRVLWLNPEPIRHWGTGDSVVDVYARHVDDVVEVRNLRQLAAFVRDLPQRRTRAAR